MIRSMTGFARRERQGPWGTLTCELRSVNHRYLELSLRLPDDLRGLESDARQLLSGNLRRGKVDAGMYLRGGPATAAALDINQPLAEQLIARASEVQALAGAAAAPIDPLEVLRWPGVIRDVERDVTPLAAAAIDLLRETAGELNAARAREGARIRQMLVQRCEALRDSHPDPCHRARGPARHAGGRRAARAGSGAARLQDGCRGGTRPARQSHRRDAPGARLKGPRARPWT